MEHKTFTPQKRCFFCGRFFQENNQVGKRQISCKRNECQKKRRQIQQKRWRQANPDYFKGRYGYIKEWRKTHPDYQKSWRAQKRSEIQTQMLPVSSIKSIRLNIRANAPLGEIQTLVLTLAQSGQALWLNGARMHPV